MFKRFKTHLIILNITMAIVLIVTTIVGSLVIEDLQGKIKVYQDKITTLQQQGEEQEKQLEEIKRVNENLLKELDNIKQENEKINQDKEKMEGVYNSLYSLLGYSPTPEEIDLLERLVECEAGCEPYKGKIAVVNVVVNRVHSKKFPNTIKGVILQKLQFEPVYNGMIAGRKVCSDSKKAVREALVNGVTAVDSNIVNFWADYLERSNPLWSHIKVKCKIGTQFFGADWID